MMVHCLIVTTILSLSARVNTEQDLAEFCTKTAIMKRVQTRWIWKTENVNIQLNSEPMTKYVTNIHNQAIKATNKISEIIPDKYVRKFSPDEFEFGDQRLKIIARIPTLLHHKCGQISPTEQWSPFSPNPEELQDTQEFFLKHGGGVEANIVLNLFHLNDQMFNNKLEGLNSPVEINLKTKWEEDGNGQFIGNYRKINNTNRYGWYYSNNPDEKSKANIVCVRKLQAWEKSEYRLPFLINLQDFLRKGVGYLAKVDTFLKKSQKIGKSVDILTKPKNGNNYPEVTLWPTKEMTTISEILSKILDVAGSTLITSKKVNQIRQFYTLATQINSKFNKASNYQKMNIPLAMPNIAAKALPKSHDRLVKPNIDYVIAEHTTTNDDYLTMGKATLYTADDSTEQNTYKIHTRILDRLNNGIAANYLVTTAGDKDYSTTHLPTYTECITMKEKLVCQQAIRAVTPQDYECGSQIVKSKTVESCPKKIINETTLTSTNCSSYSVMINNPRGDTITETCRGNLEDPNEIKGAGSQGTILLKSDCTISVGSKKIVLGNGKKQPKVHWDDMFLTLNQAGLRNQIVLPLLTIAGVAGGGCSFFLMTIILIIIAGCRGWHIQIWRKILPLRKFCLCITCNCYKNGCSRCCGCLRHEKKAEDLEMQTEEITRSRASRKAEQLEFFKGIRAFLSQSWDNLYEDHQVQKTTIVEKPILGPKPTRTTEMTGLIPEMRSDIQDDDPIIVLSSAPMEA
jgi:hypothetical protein